METKFLLLKMSANNDIFASNEDEGAGIAQSYSTGLRPGLSGLPVPVEARNCSLHYHAQTGSGAHPASYKMGTNGFFPWW
jgi:hypothetical protein